MSLSDTVEHYDDADCNYGKPDSVCPMSDGPETEVGYSSEQETFLSSFDKEESSLLFQYNKHGAYNDAASVFEAFQAATIPHGGVPDLASLLIAQHGLEDTFYVLDLGEVESCYKRWCQALPRVQPFYAVKCHPNPGMLSLLSALGAGFDCASQAEINMALEAGCPVERLIYAHPCKPPAHIRFAEQQGVNLTTFDTVSELQKIVRWHPSTELVLRIRADDPGARCCLGNKFGAEPGDTTELLTAARTMGLKVVGVSFHVGSGATNPAAFSNAISLARQVFDTALAMGFAMRLLDLGGGFSNPLGSVSAAVNEALETYFPFARSVRIIAEPGRYFAEACCTLACIINGQRSRKDQFGSQIVDYYLSDGIYGSLNCIQRDHATLTPQPLRSPNLMTLLPAAVAPRLRTTLFGPTCDGMDTIVRDYPLPQMQNGDWMLFPGMGAYTMAGACDFNGFNVSAGVKFFYVRCI